MEITGPHSVIRLPTGYGANFLEILDRPISGLGFFVSFGPLRTTWMASYLQQTST
jgi:hypothetical protein